MGWNVPLPPDVVLQAALDAEEAARIAGDALASYITLEAGQFDSTTGELEFRWGIDTYGRPYFDSTGAVVTSEAARIYLDGGRIYAEDLNV